MPVLVVGALLPFVGMFAIVAYVVIVSPARTRSMMAGLLFFLPDETARPDRQESG